MTKTSKRQRLAALQKWHDLGWDCMAAIHSGTRAEQRAANRALKAFLASLPADLRAVVKRASDRGAARQIAYFKKEYGINLERDAT